jgi:glycosyltransferase involved in cell wall biosynthesis
MPFSVAEALSTGLAVVASDLPGHRALGEGLGARRIVPLDPESISAAIQALLDRDAAAAAADAREAHEWIERNLGLELWAKRLLERYEAALSSG